MPGDKVLSRALDSRVTEVPRGQITGSASCSGSWMRVGEALQRTLRVLTGRVSRKGEQGDFGGGGSRHCVMMRGRVGMGKVGGGPQEALSSLHHRASTGEPAREPCGSLLSLPLFSLLRTRTSADASQPAHKSTSRPVRRAYACTQVGARAGASRRGGNPQSYGGVPSPCQRESFACRRQRLGGRGWR